MSDALFITGGTGFLGMELVARLLEDDDGPDLFLLARGEDRVDAMLRTLYDEVPASASRLRTVRGDLTAPGLGLTAPAGADLRANVSRVVHCAASISFTLALDEAREINVLGTQRALELARTLPGLERFVHVSTAYVAGEGFRNTYEQTKWEAEQVVATSGLPHVVVRPSIVVGESDSGWTPAFNVLYWPLQAFARGLVAELPADPRGIVDVVPVDHVVDVLAAATFAEGARGTYQAVAGEDARTVEELLALSADTLGRPAPPIVTPREADHPGGVFAPYFAVRERFDSARARTELGHAAPKLDSYFARIVAYASAARWGKRGVTRQAALQSQP